MLGSTLSLSVGKRVSLPTGIAIPTLSLAETGDTEISYTIGEVLGANQYRVEKSTDGVTYTLLANQSTHGTYTDSGLTEGQTYYYRVRAEDTLTSEVSDFRVASLALLPDFTTALLINGSNIVGGTNPLTLTIRPDTAIVAGSTLTLAGLSESQTATNASLTIAGANAAVFGSSASWNNNGTLVLTVDTGQSIPNNADTVIRFELTNPASVSSGVSGVTLSSSGFTQASISGTFLSAVDIFNVTTRDTEANILASTPTNPSGEVNIAFGTDTYDFYIYDGSAWYIFNNDFSDPIFDGQLSFPTIDVFDNESDFITDTGADDYTIVHAKDTDKLYVWNGNEWVIFNQN